MSTLISDLEYRAYRLRLHALKATSKAGSGHITSALSAADIIAVLFFHVMKFDLAKQDDPASDRFILSKGHAVPILYAAYRELGVISEDELLTYRQFDSVLEGHPTPRFEYIDVATGSLGMGLSIGAGMSLEAARTVNTVKVDSRLPYTYVLMGDSEVAEGSVWEAAEIASFYKLNKLIGIIDVNRLGQSTPTMAQYDMKDYEAKWTAFGWHVITVNGHSIAELLDAFSKAHHVKDKPVMIVAKTVKGYGLGSIEGQEGYHGKAFKKEELDARITELQERFPKASSKKEEEPVTKKRPARKEREPVKVKITRAPFGTNERIPTRKAFGIALTEYGKQVTNLFSLDGEVKNSTFAELFETAFPNRFVQCFIAEQNMVGMGVGFAARGALPVCSTFGAFFSRAFDQVRMAAIGRAPLRLVGSHAGVSIGEDGPSQMALEDIAFMRTLPESIVLYPCDAVSTFKLVGSMIEYNNGISYLRTTRGATPVIYDADEEFPVGGCKVLRQSANDVAVIVAAGITVFEAFKAYEKLRSANISIAVVDCYSIKPLDDKTIRDIAKQSNGKVITVEDHYPAGGLGEAVGFALRNDHFHITALAVDKLPRSGTSEELLAYEGIDASAIVKTVKESTK